MSMEQFTKDMNIIARLDNEPNDMGGLTAEQLKAKFDEGGLALQRYINEVILPRMGEPWQGDLLMNGYRITGLGAPVEGTDALRKMDAAPAAESTTHPGCYCRTVNGVTEWVNPPLTVGVEYRTTKRFTGKPVYAKTIEFGAMPAATAASVNVTGLSAEYVVSALGVMSSGRAFPYSTTHSTFGSVSLFANAPTAAGSVGVRVETTADLSAHTGYVTLEYTKTTD